VLRRAAGCWSCRPVGGRSRAGTPWSAAQSPATTVVPTLLRQVLGYDNKQYAVAVMVAGAAVVFWKEAAHPFPERSETALWTPKLFVP